MGGWRDGWAGGERLVGVLDVGVDGGLFQVLDALLGAPELVLDGFVLRGPILDLFLQFGHLILQLLLLHVSFVCIDREKIFIGGDLQLQLQLYCLGH